MLWPRRSLQLGYAARHGCRRVVRHGFSDWPCTDREWPRAQSLIGFDGGLSADLGKWWRTWRFLSMGCWLLGEYGLPQGGEAEVKPRRPREEAPLTW